MKVVITGGSGAVGRRLTHELRSLGFDVLVLSRTPRENSDSVATTYEVDQLRPLLRAADAIVHLAWRRTPSRHFSDFFTSLNATESVLNAAIAEGVPRLVAASSVSVYSGDPPWHEECRPRAASHYGLSKLVGEDLLNFGERRGISTLSLRLGHVYTDDEINDYAVNAFIQNAEAGKPIRVEGDSLRRRDMVYAGDVVHAFRLALVARATGVLNIGSGHPVSIGEIASAATIAFGGRSQVARHDQPINGSGSTHMLLDQARAELGYVPQFSIQEGMQDIAQRRGHDA